MVVYSIRSCDTASLFMVVKVHDTVKDLVTPSHCSRYVQVQNGTVFCTCTYQEQREGVTRSFTVSCTYTTMNKEAVSRDLLLYPAPAYNMFMLITTVTSLAGCFFNCVLQECIYPYLQRN
jgi:hypothetical protein